MRFYPHVTDQVVHFVVAFLILSLALVGTVWASALAGLSIGIVREVTEASGSRITVVEVKDHFAKGSDPWIDLLFWMLGGAAWGVLFA